MVKVAIVDKMPRVYKKVLAISQEMVQEIPMAQCGIIVQICCEMEIETAIDLEEECN